MDEHSKPHPLVVYEQDKNNKSLSMKLDYPWYKFNIPNVVKVYWLAEPDGVTEYYALHYYDYLLKYLPIKSWPELLFK